MLPSDYPHWDGAWADATSELLAHNEGECPTAPWPVWRGQRPPFLRPCPSGPSHRSSTRAVVGSGRDVRRRKHDDSLDLEDFVGDAWPTRCAPGARGRRANERPRRRWRRWRRPRRAVGGSTTRDASVPFPPLARRSGVDPTVRRIELRTPPVMPSSQSRPAGATFSSGIGMKARRAPRPRGADPARPAT